MHTLSGVTLVALAWASTRAHAQEGDGLLELGPVLESVLSESEVPGIGAAIVTSDGLLALGVAGLRERGSDARILVEDRFHIGSCTKAMTATLIGRAVEAGDLRWDTPLPEALPELDETMHEAWRPVTLAQVLAHTAGVPKNLRNHPDLLPTYLSKTRSMPEVRFEVVEGFLSAPPEAEPGKRFAYANLGYVLAGTVLEHLEQRPWEEIVQEQLFEPLGMASAGFGDPGAPYFAEAPEAAETSAPSQPRGHFDDGRVAIAFDNAPALGPAGTVHCTLRDWSKFALLHLRGARGAQELLLEPGTFAALHTGAPGTGHLRNWRKTEYGGGWVVTTRAWADGRLLMHDGSNTAWFAHLWIAPEDDFAILTACNQGGEQGRKAVERATERLAELLARHREAEDGD